MGRGKYAICIGMKPEVLHDLLNMGAPVGMVKIVEGGLHGCGSANIAVVNSRPHPNVTAVFVNRILRRGHYLL